MICTFFGHRNAPNEIIPTLRSVLINLILNNNVNVFYVGNQGNFDRLVQLQLQELSTICPIKYFVVLAYIPIQINDYQEAITENSILPDGIEKVPKRFAIDYRNKWMIKKSDYVITYVNNISSNSIKFKDLAERQKKVVINIPEL